MRPVPLNATSERHCPRCSAPQTTFLAGTWRGEEQWFWRECQCQLARNTAASARLDQLRTTPGPQAITGTSMEQVAHFQLATFEPERLLGAGDEHPFNIATSWLAQILDRRCGDYRDPDAPQAALYFYAPSDGKGDEGTGRGKTHLAAGLLWEAHRQRKLTVYVDEYRYIDRYLGADLSEHEALAGLPGERAWLTLIDDIGRRQIAGKGAGIQSAWADLITRRWNARGWTIITSNWTLEELVDRKTIDLAIYSRLYQMTRGEYVVFDGVDQRLV